MCDDEEPRIRDILRGRIVRRWRQLAAWVRYAVLRRPRPLSAVRAGASFAEWDKALREIYRERPADLAAKGNPPLASPVRCVGGVYVVPKEPT